MNRLVTLVSTGIEAARGAINAHPQFLIVGTGRCGTAAAAATLNQVGIRCGHEEVFTPFGRKYRPRLVGEASWLAVPHLATTTDAYVIHLVREPIATVQSFLDIGFFDPDQTNPFAQYARQYFATTGDPMEDAFRWYLEWNIQCEKYASRRYQLAELPALINDLALQLLRSPPPLCRLQELAKAKCNEKCNEKRRRHLAGYDAIKDDALREAVLHMNARYGFSSDSHADSATHVAGVL